MAKVIALLCLATACCIDASAQVSSSMMNQSSGYSFDVKKKITTTT